MALKADIKTAFQNNLSAANRNRFLAAFLSAYNYTKGDGNGNQIPMVLPGDQALVADAAVDSILEYIKGIVKAEEKREAIAAVPDPAELPTN